MSKVSSNFIITTPYANMTRNCIYDLLRLFLMTPAMIPRRLMFEILENQSFHDK